MSETSTLAAAAAQAASAGDIPSAAALLQRTLELQERTLGPEHREIATTLNNLALMLERLDRVNEAGRCYRRAYVVAKKALGPDDPAVQVSRANLAAFVEEHGGEASELATGAGRRSPQDDPSPSIGLAGVFASDDIWESSAAGAAAGRTTPAPAAEPARAESVARWNPERAVVGTTYPTEESSSQSPSESHASVPAGVAPPHASGGRSSVSPWWALVAAAALVVVAGWYALTRDVGETSAPPAAEAVEGAGPSSPPAPAPPAASSTAPPGPSMSAGAATAAADISPTETPSPPAAPSTPSGSPAPRPTINEVADAGACTSLTRSPDVWRCETAAAPALGTAVYYYTRVRSPRDGSIRHRWVHNGNLVAERTLRIQANATYGFRTFTRQTLSQPGEWQVLLIGMDGTILDERSFHVR
jgi:hypothetical protein